jgi:hypothetical protein
MVENRTNIGAPAGGWLVRAKVRPWVRGPGSPDPTPHKRRDPGASGIGIEATADEPRRPQKPRKDQKQEKGKQEKPKPRLKTTIAIRERRDLAVQESLFIRGFRGLRGCLSLLPLAMLGERTGGRNVQEAIRVRPRSSAADSQLTSTMATSGAIRGATYA